MSFWRTFGVVYLLVALGLLVTPWFSLLGVAVSFWRHPQ